MDVIMENVEREETLKTTMMMQHDEEERSTRQNVRIKQRPGRSPFCLMYRP